MDKPTKPNISIPESFANNGTKTDFSETKIENGFERFTPEVLAGDNLNKFIDDTYKGLNYSIKTSDAVNLINDEEILTIQNNSFRTLPLQNPLAYSTGKTSEDNILFNELKKRKRSTFDLSKFEVVGSLVITDDGIASGFSSSNLIYKDVDLDNKSFVIETPVYSYTQVNSSADQWLINLGTYNNKLCLNARILTSGKLSIGIQNDDKILVGDSNTTAVVGNTYQIKFVVNTSKAEIYLSTNGGKYVLVKSANNADLYTLNNNILNISNAYYLATNPFLGSIDLKQFSITVDGKEAFSGNKTGLDVIKPDNYEVVGSPTISDDGIASGFSSSNYLTVSTNIDNTTSKVSVVMDITIGDVSSLTHSVFFGSTLTNHPIKIGNNYKIWFYGTGWTSGKTVYSIGDAVSVKYEYDVTTAKATIFSKLKNETDWIEEGYYTPASNPIGGTFYLGRNATTVLEYHTGSIDLNAFKIYVNGNLVYQPCLKIPYTESKTGSKIVDEAYRDRVIDLYEQQGQAGYYTIDEENKNFTLPMGEIYGMIEGKADKDMLNNPYSFGDSKYSSIELNNISWLASNGQWNAKATYPDYYNWILENVNNGVEGFKLSTAEDITDYDFVINTSDETFRLPLLDGSEDLLSDRYEDLELLASGSTYIAPANGIYCMQKVATTTGKYIAITNLTTSEIQSDRSSVTNQNLDCAINVKRNDNVSILYTAEGATNHFHFVYAQGNGTLYYYVGETVQNANLIDAGRIGEQLANKLDLNANNLDVSGKSLISGLGMPSDKYVDLTLGASGSTYTAPANGYYYIAKISTATNQHITLRLMDISDSDNDQNMTKYLVHPYSGAVIKCYIPCRKGCNVKLEYSAGGTTKCFRFIYAEGSKED